MLFSFSIAIFSCQPATVNQKGSSELEVVTKSDVPTENIRGKELYSQLCAVCHGASGQGDGVAGKSLPVKPRNFIAEKFKSGSDFESVKQVIAYGYKNGQTGMVGWKSSLKSEEDLDSLTRYIRAFVGLK